MPLSPRRVQVVLGLVLAASLLSLTISVINWVQAENTRDAQAQELELLTELQQVEGRIDAGVASVAAFVEEVRAQQARGPSSATLRLYALVEDMARTLGVEVPDPPPSSGNTTTTTTAQ